MCYIYIYINIFRIYIKNINKLQQPKNKMVLK